MEARRIIAAEVLRTSRRRNDQELIALLTLSYFKLHADLPFAAVGLESSCFAAMAFEGFSQRPKRLEAAG